MKGTLKEKTCENFEFYVNKDPRYPNLEEEKNVMLHKRLLLEAQLLSYHINVTESLTPPQDVKLFRLYLRCL